MKVLIAAAAFSSEMSGVQRHAFNVARSLLLHRETRAVYLAVAPWQRRIAEDIASHADERLVIHAAEMSKSSIGRNSWYYRHLPELARALDVDAVHLSYPAPVSAKRFHCPVAVTLHDMYPYEIPENFGFPKHLVNRAILRQCLNEVDGIACVSEATRKRLREYLPARLEEKTVCIPNCVLPMPEPVQPAATGWRSEPFMLCVAQHRRNKNIPLLLGSFARLVRAERVDARMRLLVIGIPGPETKRIHRAVVEYGLDGRVSFLSGLSEPELHWCYANCEALVAPSSTEGFGFPVAEGLLAGSRVVCSEIVAHREIGAGRCHFVSLRGGTESALADAICAALREARPEPVSLPQFSAEVIGRQYLRFYRSLMEARVIESRRGLGIEVRGA